MSARWRVRLFGLAILYFTFVGGTFLTDLSFWPRVAHHAIVTAILLGWIVGLWRRRSTIPATPLDLPLTGVFIAYAVATLFARDPRVSVESLWHIGVHILFFFILVDMMRAWRPQAVLEPLFFASSVVILVGVFEFISWYFGLKWLPIFQQGWFDIGGLSQPIPPTIYRLSFTLGVSTYLSAYLGLLIPVGLAWALSTTSSQSRSGLWLWLAGAMPVLVLSFSRGGLLSVGVSVPIFGVLFVLGQPERRVWLARIMKGWRLAGAAIAPLVLLAGVAFIWTRQVDVGGHSAGDLIRSNLFDSAWQVGFGHPITGVGPYGFGRALRPYRDSAITGDHFTAAHNIPLQVWAESGLIGLLTMASLALTVVWVALRRWRGASGTERVRVAGVAAALIGFSAHNLADSFTSTPILLPFLALIAYLVAPLEFHFGTASSPIRQVAHNLVAFLVAVSAVGWIVSDLAQYHFNRALQLAARDDLDGAVEAIQTARSIDPTMGYYAFQRAQYLGELATQNRAVLPKALDAYVSALKLERTYALNNANAAILLAQSGDTAGAAAQMQEALSWQIDDPRYALGYAVFSEQQGNRDVAQDAYRDVLEMNPEWIDSIFWEASTVRQEARTDFLEVHGLLSVSPQLLGSVAPQCWPVTMPLNRYAGIASTAFDGPRCKAEVALHIDDNLDMAIRFSNEAIGIDPAQPSAYLVRAAAYQIRGDAAAAERDARTALFLQDTHAYAILGSLAENRGDAAAAEKYYLAGAPLVVQLQGWDVSVYARRGDLRLLPQFDAPGPSRYDFAAWDALVELYVRQGRVQDAQKVRDTILRLDPFHRF